jgi:hypothetical protein
MLFKDEDGVSPLGQTRRRLAPCRPCPHHDYIVHRGPSVSSGSFRKQRNPFSRAVMFSVSELGVQGFPVDERLRPGLPVADFSFRKLPLNNTFKNIL